MAVIKESDIGINIRSAPSASGDHCIRYQRDRGLFIVQGGVWLNDKGKWKTGFFQKGVSCGNSIDSRPHIMWGTIGMERW